jgi:sugar phosphate isomerase/epimerase
VGGDLNELRELVIGFNPAQVGVAFDIAHALVVHGSGWREQFELLKSHIRIVYIKDVALPNQWVALGKGDVGKQGYFKLLKELPYRGPISLHVEYDWDDKGKLRTREHLLTMLKSDLAVLRGWLREA